MKTILKMFLLPIILIMKIVCLFGKLLSNISFIFSLLFLLLVGYGIYCVVHAMWTSLAILAAMGVTAFLILFAIVFLTVQAEATRDNLGKILHS